MILLKVVVVVVVVAVMVEDEEEEAVVRCLSGRRGGKVSRRSAGDANELCTVASSATVEASGTTEQSGQGGDDGGRRGSGRAFGVPGWKSGSRGQLHEHLALPMLILTSSKAPT